MPMYQYMCSHCSAHVEMLQKFSDPIATTCPHCNQDTLQKQLTAPAFQLKGSGWYVTDFKNPAPKAKPDHATKDAEASKQAGKDSDNTTAATDSETSQTKASSTTSTADE